MCKKEIKNNIWLGIILFFNKVVIIFLIFVVFVWLRCDVLLVFNFFCFICIRKIKDNIVWGKKRKRIYKFKIRLDEYK